MAWFVGIISGLLKKPNAIGVDHKIGWKYEFWYETIFCIVWSNAGTIVVEVSNRRTVDIVKSKY